VKKLFVIAILAIVLLVGGCQTLKDAFCNNRVIIENSVTAAQNMIVSIQTTFGSFIPPEYMAVISAANVVITMGNNYLTTVTCPTAAQVAEVQGQQTTMASKAQVAAKLTTIQMKRQP